MLPEVGPGEVCLIGRIGDDFQAGEGREAAADLLGEAMRGGVFVEEGGDGKEARRYLPREPGIPLVNQRVEAGALPVAGSQ